MVEKMLASPYSAATMLESVVVFRHVSQSDILNSLKEFLVCEGSEQERVRKYSDFVASLFSLCCDFSSWLLESVLNDDNQYIRLRALNGNVPAPLQKCVDNELKIFQLISEITSSDLIALTGYEGYLPSFESSTVDFEKEYTERITHISSIGYGIYAHNTMFRVSDSKIIPIKSPDITDINHLIGYESERAQLIDNTRNLINGYPSANVLLCGDAGTGKSTSVKAVVNMFSLQGLRLIELRKDQLLEIPSVMEQIRDNPLKFIIFIDDLSFNKNDDNFSSLKAILEGTASIKASNTAIYVTSNRRHLIKESFSDRDGDDIHRTDTMQELISLSSRFGLTILFSRPSKPLYLEIVYGLCKEKNILEDPEKLESDACAFALRKGGFTPRAAEQFTDSLLSKKQMEESN